MTYYSFFVTIIFIGIVLRLYSLGKYYISIVSSKLIVQVYNHHYELSSPGAATGDKNFIIVIMNTW